MTVPFERTRAVNSTREFLLELTNPKETPRLPLDIRRRALHLLRHYPTDFDMRIVCEREDYPNKESPLTYKVFGDSFV